MKFPAPNIEYAVRALYPHKPQMDAHAAMDTLIDEVTTRRQQERALYAMLDVAYPGWQMELRRAPDQMSTAGT